MWRYLIVVLGWMAAGCATDPLAQLETATPTLSPAQVADLQKRARSAEALGIQMRLTADYAEFAGQRMEAPAGSVTVPLVKIPTDKPGEAGGHYRVPVVLATVNGKPNTRVLLDSGSNRNLFGYSLARSLGIPAIAGVKPVTAYGIGGAVENHLAVVPTMRLGALEFRNLPVLIGPDAQALSLTRSFWGHRQVMILGVNALKRLSFLCIDSLRGTVTLSPDEAYLPEEGSEFVTTVPLRWEGELPVVEVTLDGRHTYPCVLDTGGDYGMLVPRTKAIEIGYWKPGKGPLSASRGIAGASLTTTYEIKQVKVGGATFTRVPARTDVVGPEVAGGRVLLGNVVLRRHRVTLDFKNNLLWLER